MGDTVDIIPDGEEENEGRDGAGHAVIRHSGTARRKFSVVSCQLSVVSF
jgi:hypothetical protein